LIQLSELVNIASIGLHVFDEDHLTERITVLVTGGAGYIGAHCCKALFEAGYSPICFDNLSTGHRDFVRWGPLVVGDIVDSDALKRTLLIHRISAVIHFAAFSLVGESVADPQKYFVNNVVGTLSLLGAMREVGCDKLVFSSTGAVYGSSGLEPVREDAAGRPVNSYGASKWMIEQILDEYRRAYQFNAICLRYFNASGADPSGEVGEFREVETHLIPRAMMAVGGLIRDFSIFGDDYDTPDGTAIRDYIHVSDLAAAHVLALTKLLQGDAGGSFNLGTGEGTSVRQVLTAIGCVSGRKVPVQIKPRRAGDPPLLVADPSAARQQLGFETVYSDLSTIVKSAWAWHQKVYPG
jgi:UDP-arabinose 4-epimerase